MRRISDMRRIVVFLNAPLLAHGERKGGGAHNSHFSKKRRESMLMTMSTHHMSYHQSFTTLLSPKVFLAVQCAI